MKQLFLILVMTCAISAPGVVFAASDDEPLLSSLHQYGITKCDKLILEHSKLKTHWSIFVSKHKNIAGTKEASVIQIYGNKMDTVKTDVSYIQTQNACHAYVSSTVTYSGPCVDNIDKDFWYVSKAMPNTDYTKYSNKGGVDMFVKEIEVGNFKACVQETTRRTTSPHG